MTSIPWLQHLSINTDPNRQVKQFIFLNIMSDFIPNKTNKFVPRDPPWITKPLKTLLIRKIGSLKVTKTMGMRMRTKLCLKHFVLMVKKKL